MADEDDCAYIDTACVILHNMCLAKGENSEVDAVIDTEHYLRPIDESISDKTPPGKKQTDALLFFVSGEVNH